MKPIKNPGDLPKAIKENIDEDSLSLAIDMRVPISPSSRSQGVWIQRP